MKTTRKTICCLLAALLTLLSLSSVMASAAEDNGFGSGYAPDDGQRLTDESGRSPYEELNYRTHTITAARFEQLIGLAQERLEELYSVTGSKYDRPALREFEDALAAAKTVAADEEAGFDEITAAYKRLYDAMGADMDAHDHLDETTLTAIYDYTQGLLDDHCDAFDEENRSTLEAIGAQAFDAYHYGCATQEEVNIACTGLFQKLKKVKTVGKPDGFIPPKKYAGIYSVVWQLLHAAHEEEAPPCIDYTPLLEADGYYLVSARSAIERPLELFVHIGDYIYEADEYSDPSDLGCLLVNPDSGDWLTLEEGLEQEVISGGAVYALYQAGELGFAMSLAGDVNRDGRLDITDATAIQMLAARYAPADGWDKRYADFNNDDQLDITDATAVQCRIAGIRESVDVPFTQPMTVMQLGVASEDFVHTVFSDMHVIRSIAELNAVFDDLGRRVDFGDDGIAPIRARFDAYDNAFFRDHALVLWDGLEGYALADTPGDYHFDALTRKGNTLTVRATCAVDLFGAPCNTFFAIAYTVDRPAVEGVTAVKPLIKTYSYDPFDEPYGSYDNTAMLPFTVITSTTDVTGDFDGQDVRLIRSAEELKSSGVMPEGTFDDAFFAENALIVWRSHLGYLNTDLGVYAVYRTLENRLLVGTVERTPALMQEVESYNCVFCSVRQEDVAEIADVGYTNRIV